MTVELNKEQKAVIDHKDGPILVLAGPGTGKTLTIVERVQELVKISSVNHLDSPNH